MFSEFILLGFSVDPQPDSALQVVSDDLPPDPVGEPGNVAGYQS